MSSRAILLRAFVVLVLLAIGRPALAATPQSLVTPFDKTYVRTNGAPNGGSDVVTVPTTAGLWFLTVESSGATAGSVSLNGAQIFGSSDFKSGTSLLRASVTVSASTTIDVSLHGKPGEQIRVRLQGIVPDASIPASLVQHVFQRSFFSQTFPGGSSTFTLPTAEGLFWLDVHNGDAQGNKRASAASIALNGVTVFGPGSFSQQVGALSAPVVVAASNTLAVNITGPKDAILTVTVWGYGVDTVPPTLTIDEPLDGVWHSLSGSMRLSYSDSISGIDQSSLTVMVNGSAVTSHFAATASLASASLTSLYPPLHEGANTVVATIADQACNVTTKQIQALIDSRPPEISIVPGEGTVTSNHPTFQITLTDPSPGSGVNAGSLHVTLDGNDVTSAFSLSGSTASGTFTNLTPGSHTIHVTASDMVGNAGQAVVHFRVVQPPRITLSPADGAVTNDTLPAILVVHTADGTTTIDLSSVHLTLDGTSLTPVAQVQSASVFLPTAPLSEGVHTIEVSVSDSLGNSVTVTSSFTVELTATHFGVSIAPSDPGSVLVNSINDLRIEALTASGLTATRFVGDIQITTSDGLATLDQLIATMTIANQGVLTIPNRAIVRQLGLVTVHAVALASPTVTGSLNLTGVSFVPTLTPVATNADGSTTLTITAVPNSNFTILVDGQVYATGQVSASGTFILTINLPPGIHTVQVVTVAPDGSIGRSPILRIGPPTTITGVILAGPIGADQPLGGVPVSVEGTTATAITADDGRFTLTNVPVGNRVVKIDASRSQTSDGSTFGIARIGVVASTSVTLSTVVMRPVDYASGTTIPISGLSAPVPALTATNPLLPRVSVTVGPGVLTLPSGAPTTLTVSQVSLLDLPIRIPPSLVASQFISVGPEGGSIDGGFKLTFPNADGVPPGQSTPVWHYVPETAKWEIVATATATADGTTLETDPVYFGIYAAQAPNGTPHAVLLRLFDEFDQSVPRNSRENVTVLGTGLADADENLVLGSVPFVDGYLLKFMLLPSATSTVVRVTREFEDGTSVTVTKQIPVGPSSSPQEVSIRVARPATLTGTVVAMKNDIIVRNATVFSNGRFATTDQYGRFTLVNVPVISSDMSVPSTTSKFSVSASKFIGASFTGQRTNIDSTTAVLGSPYSVGPIAIDAELASGGPLFVSQTVANYFGPNFRGFASLVYQPQLGRFFTRNVTDGTIWQIERQEFGGVNPIVGPAIGTGAAGLDRSTLALGHSLARPSVNPNTLSAGLWAADGHSGTVYSIFFNPASTTAPALVELAASRLNPLGAGTPVQPLTDNFDQTIHASTPHDAFGAGDALVQFHDRWYRIGPGGQTGIAALFVIHPNETAALSAGMGQLFHNSSGGISITYTGAAVILQDSNLIHSSETEALARGGFGYMFLSGTSVRVTGPGGPATINSPQVLGAPTPTAGVPQTLYSTSDTTSAFLPSGIQGQSITHYWQGQPPFYVGASAQIVAVGGGGSTLTTGFTPSALRIAAANNSNRTFFAIGNDRNVPGLGTWGTSLIAIRQSDGHQHTVYEAPVGKTLVGLALAPSQAGQTALYVWQTDLQAVVSNGSDPVHYELVEVRSVTSLFTIWDDLATMSCPCGGQLSRDCDNDFLANDLETAFGLDICRPDSNLDGLSDYVQLVNLGDPTGFNLPPSVVRTFPQSGATNVLLDAPIYVDFSEAMRAGELQSSFTLTGNGKTVTGTFDVIFGTPERAIFRPSSNFPLDPNVQYTATISVQAQGLTGRFFSTPFTFTFTTGAELAETTDGHGLLNIERQLLGLQSVPPGRFDSILGGGISDYEALCALGQPHGEGAELPGVTPRPTKGPITPTPNPGNGTLIPETFNPVDGQTDVNPLSLIGVTFNGPVTGLNIGMTSAGPLPRVVVRLERNGVAVDGQVSVDPTRPNLVVFIADGPLASGIPYDLIAEVVAPEVPVITRIANFITGNIPTGVAPPDENEPLNYLYGGEYLDGLEPTCACLDCGYGEYARVAQFMVNAATGNLLACVRDSFCPGRCPPVEFIRTYRSNDFPFGTGVLGPKWHLNYETRFVRTDSAGNLMHVLPDGRFFPAPGSPSLGWTSPRGLHDVAIRVIPSPYFGGGPCILQRKKDGTRLYYAPVPQNPGDAAYLVRIEDRNEQFITFNRDSRGRLTSLIDTIGRTTTLTYYPDSGTPQDGRLEKIQDHSGRFWKYIFNNDGDLARVETPATEYFDEDDNGNIYGPFNGPKAIEYSYSPGHLLAAVNVPKACEHDSRSPSFSRNLISLVVSFPEELRLVPLVR